MSADPPVTPLRTSILLGGRGVAGGVDGRGEPGSTWREALMRNVRADGARLAASAGLTPRSRPGVERALNALDGMAAAIASFSDPRGVYLYCGCDLR